MSIVKIHHSLEPLFIFLTMNLQPIIGILSGVCISWYYLAMLKRNIVDKDYDGMWLNYIKHVWKHFINKQKKKK